MPKYEAFQPDLHTTNTFSWQVVENYKPGVRVVHLQRLTKIQAIEIAEQLNTTQPELTIQVTLKKLNELRMLQDWQLRQEGYIPESITAAWQKLVK